MPFVDGEFVSVEKWYELEKARIDAMTVAIPDPDAEPEAFIATERSEAVAQAVEAATGVTLAPIPSEEDDGE